MNKPILLLDFDGVVHSYTSKWTTATDIHDKPVTGFHIWAIEAKKRFTLCIYSSRSKEPGGIEAMKTWIRAHYPNVKGMEDWFEFPKTKPAAFLTIDDRAICFEGNWFDPKLDPENLLKFKPWNK